MVFWQKGLWKLNAVKSTCLSWPTSITYFRVDGLRGVLAIKFETCFWT
jgi:hypothetical protein